MMTKDEMVKVLEALGNDVWFDVEDSDIDVTINDFEGFDDDWSEVMRDYDDPEAIGAFLEMLEEQCVSQEGDFYVIYHFEDFDLQLGFGSFDI